MPTKTARPKLKPAAPPGLRTELVPIASLTPDPKNARRHGDRNIDAIKMSLAQFGQQKPIVVDANGVVLAGNGTLEAARALGWTEIAIVRTTLSGDAARAFAVADNRSGELASWDNAALAGLLEDLRKIEDIEIPGFTDEEISSLVASAGLDADVAHFAGLAGGNGEANAAEASAAPATGLAAGELSLVITGPRAVIERIRTLINDARQRDGVATLAEAVLVLIDRPATTESPS